MSCRAIFRLYGIHDKIKSGEYGRNIFMIGTAFGSKIAVCGGPACHFLRSYAAVNVTEGGNNHSSGSGAATVFTDTVCTAIEKVSPMTVMLIIIGHRAQCGIQIDIVVIIGRTSIIVFEGVGFCGENGRDLLVLCRKGNRSWIV